MEKSIVFQILCFELFWNTHTESLLYDTGSADPMLCYNLDGWSGWDVGGRCKKERTYVHLWLIHVDVWEDERVL